MKKSVAAIFVFAVIALVLVISQGYQSFTGLQVLDLPQPPPTPGIEADQQTTTTTAPVEECGNDIVEGDEECELDSDCASDEECVACLCFPKPTSDAADILDDVDIPEGDDIEDLADKLDALEQKLEALDLLPGFEERLNNVEMQTAIAAGLAARIDTLESRVDSLRVDVDNIKQQAQRPFVEAPTFFEELGNLGDALKKRSILSISLSILVLLIIIGMLTSYIFARRHEHVENKKLITDYLRNYQKAGYSLDSLKMHLKASGWDDKFIDECIKDVHK